MGIFVDPVNGASICISPHLFIRWPVNLGAGVNNSQLHAGSVRGRYLTSPKWGASYSDQTLWFSFSGKLRNRIAFKDKWVLFSLRHWNYPRCIQPVANSRAIQLGASKNNISVFKRRPAALYAENAGRQQAWGPSRTGRNGRDSNYDGALVISPIRFSIDRGSDIRRVEISTSRITLVDLRRVKIRRFSMLTDTRIAPITFAY